jgi:hypothetical protein
VTRRQHSVFWGASNVRHTISCHAVTTPRKDEPISMHAHKLANLILCAPCLSAGLPAQVEVRALSLFVCVVSSFSLRAFLGCDCLQLRPSATDQQFLTNILASVLHIVHGGSNGSATSSSCSLMALPAVYIPETLKVFVNIPLHDRCLFE